MQSLVSVLLLAASLGLAWRVPRSAPYLVIVGSVVLIPSGRYSSEIPVLLGTILGTALRRMQAGGWVELVPRRWITALPLFALSAVTLLSWLVNASVLGNSATADLAVATRWFVLRLLVLAVLLIWEPWQFDDLLVPLLSAAGVLLLVRVGQAFDLNAAHSLAAHLSLLSDTRSVGDFNLFAGFLTLVLPGVLVRAAESEGARAWAWRLVGLSLVWSLATTASRTGALVLLSQCALLLLVLRTWRQRAWVSVAVAFFLVLGVGMGYLSNKAVYENAALPSYMHPTTAASQSTAGPSGRTPGPITAGGVDSVPNAGDPPRDPAKPEADWRSLLWRPGVELLQTVSLQAVPAEPTLYIAARRGHESSVTGVAVLVDGAPVTTVPGTAISDGELDWVLVPLDKAALAGKQSMQIALRLVGSGNMTRDYVEIGGLRAKAPAYTSAFSNGKAVFETDLSPDAGPQTGLFQVFLGQRRPSGLVALPPAQSQQALSTSLSDRLALWKAAGRNFRDNPLAGTGLYTFRNVYTKYLDQPMFEEYASSHNMYLQVLSDIGVLGASVFLIIVLGPLLVIAWRLLLILWRREDRPSTAVWLPGLSLLSVALTSMMHVWIADVRYYVPALLVVTLACSFKLPAMRPSVIAETCD